MDTTLSPRLRHLLIKEDGRTGRLIHPEGYTPRESITELTPPLSPASYGFTPSPLEKPLRLPTPPTHAPLLPLPRLQHDRRPSTSIFTLLNDLHVDAPSTSFSSTSRSRQIGYGRYSPPVAPLSASHIQPPSGLDPHRRSSTAPRPDLFRRHSSHPYEYGVTTPRPATSYQPSDFAPVVGSRAPISRTTKACNACRSRKVRCDAGGSASGEPSTCSRCRESGGTCVYSGVQKKRGPCLGTTRPVQIPARPRRPSGRSSISSRDDVITPPDEYPSQTPSSSYGFPSSTDWTSSAPQSFDSNATLRARPATVDMYCRGLRWSRQSKLTMIVGV
ncbi:hypothetical protein BCR39DRAFT_506624 [Naematelia encephala]|uniref:Zn(2)-C6 fungal-type domain-containing protein n=1 Tax=Naematelia encephala TaxID=71784 RepID=A0A1Y2AXG2_9TREE|nr:hypothetical protein BCR39DRAFT_506624 [Naematelia encephala]